ncbi:MAG: diguanylate cyclase (GGDEF)-like protein [Oceanicoccus sp.]|jgi:diguanylate cyclase (GGDEF)-like protein
MEAKSKILLIGAEATFQSDFCQQLNSHHPILVANNADQVIDITADDEAIGILMLDVEGLGPLAQETCMWLKTDNETRDMPLIALLDSEVGNDQWLQSGVLDYVLQSTPVALASARVKNLLGLEYKTRLLTGIVALDALTASANSTRFDEYIDIEWRRSLRDYYPLTLICLDIDGFSAYNDSYGLGSGDDALKQVARVCQQHCNRAADMVSRYSNDEFIVLLPANELEQGLMLAERIVHDVEALAISYNESEIAKVLTVSAGVASIEPSRDRRYQDLLEEAQEMLYSAQQGGGNQSQGIAI